MGGCDNADGQLQTLAGVLLHLIDRDQIGWTAVVSSSRATSHQDQTAAGTAGLRTLAQQRRLDGRRDRQRNCTTGGGDDQKRLQLSVG